MAHIWTRVDKGEWHPVALVDDEYVLAQELRRADSKPFDREPTAPQTNPDTVLLRRTASVGEDRWALLPGPLARPLVNGLPVPLGLVVLADRDEIRWRAATDSAIAPAGLFFFSTERLARVGPYPPDPRRGSCPRCKQALTPGDPAVRCPGCGLWHHATEALPCWTYGEQCAACPQPTSLDAGFRWTPEDL